MYAKSVIHRSRREGVWLLLSLSFYLGFALADGPVLCVDTQSYLDMDYSREPLYPLFLAGLRAVFGTAPSRYGADIPRYLVAAVLVQAVAMAVCVWYFVRVIGSTAVDARGEERSSIGFRKAGGAGNASAGRSGEREGFRTFLLFSICWGVDLLNRFAARRGSMYMESIMTESFAIPLFLVFLACAYLFFRTHRPGRLIACTVLMFVLISLRKQMAVSAVILVCFSLLYDLIRRRRWKPFAACVLAAGIAFGGAALADYSYNFALRGVWMHKTHNYKGADCTLIYTARAEDASLFDDPEEQELFAKIYSECRARGLTWEGCQTSGWIGRAEHFAQSYDVIGFDVMLPILRERVQQENPDIDDVHLALRMDEYMKALQDGLVRQNLSRFAALLGVNLLAGLSTTILRETPLLSAVSFCLFAAYLARMLVLWRRCRGMRKPPVLLLAALVLISIVANCLTVGSMIFPQTRYMIYNMAPFYCTGFLMLSVEPWFTTDTSRQ